MFTIIEPNIHPVFVHFAYALTTTAQMITGQMVMVWKAMGQVITAQMVIYMIIRPCPAITPGDHAR